jgi:hypothetical protein
MFLAFVCVVVAVCFALAILASGPDPEDRLATEEWRARQREEDMRWLHKTDGKHGLKSDPTAPGLTHTDDLRP